MTHALNRGGHKITWRTSLTTKFFAVAAHAYDTFVIDARGGRGGRGGSRGGSGTVGLFQSLVLDMVQLGLILDLLSLILDVLSPILDVLSLILDL